MVQMSFGWDILRPIVNHHFVSVTPPLILVVFGIPVPWRFLDATGSWANKAFVGDESFDREEIDAYRNWLAESSG